MDRHDRPSPGRYNESSPASPTEFLSSEHSPRPRTGRRTLALSAAVAVVAAAVAAGGVIVFTGGSTPEQSTQKSSWRASEQDAGEAADDGDATALDSDDASAEAPAAADPGSSGGAGGALDISGSGSGDSGGSGGSREQTPVAKTAGPSGGESAKNKKNPGGESTDSQGARPGPDGPVGYVAPYQAQPGRASGLGADFFRDLRPSGPTAKPTSRHRPTAKPTASPTAKPTASPTAKPTATPSKSPAKPAPSPTSTGKGPSSIVTAEDEVARLTNAARQEQGCGPLRIDEKLRQAARGHSDDMAAKGYFDHNSQDGRTPWDRIKAAGYTSNMYAENIARGQQTPEAVVKAWLNSPGHRANIMNCKLKAIGVGVHFGSGGPWWTQDFGGS
ncbi:hypothetical protein Ssi03_44680 [Sphaerisporangium siamense]|uniref:Uncharacterized protein YkwD n=1 Tax=Sphaerisporangium siamense TaxID=795645 RepID=A0A7W7GDU8_9ACTN|nr:CAP domain-containing protein [Sphaerisporangium siamense]MBB4705370.1 uncharacterized protein YkwD [Sphaerisporangium siamense]GII86478.1 hypothetical protein Ssi03_44680 [Sphaerisporangium siamense]